MPKDRSKLPSEERLSPEQISQIRTLLEQVRDQRNEMKRYHQLAHDTPELTREKRDELRKLIKSRLKVRHREILANKQLSGVDPNRIATIPGLDELATQLKEQLKTEGKS